MRGKSAVKRVLENDPIYNSRLVTRFINKIMKDGKKSVAQRLVYDALAQIEQATGKNPLSTFDAAIANVSPKMEVRPRRVGGASYQVPTEVRGDRKEALAIRWLIAAADSRSNKEYKSFSKKLAAEILDAAKGTGVAIKKKEDTLRMAESNRAFSHFRW
ncbi:MAG: 30S ribosomal protein S7 [Candidatus Daviesbacteria bacterium GW2011_GWA2_38_24]|uniref:Small ribosomal subunit protein uS7 n=1 Tax=Candidatus Daviesbacteria bacterium GW2011_GWA2_38_24 TaxID=1618422 RepID=A0A0G0JI95_9BACT|nr:MAG: 30S ribosomal protein S7 [Candidatus Daviesbacteria bacterium GW2011_GWA2_38_24]KKQ79855.1 MAG: 30S ribosomal protein S7 [Candidatus Daviesbacteria bacterium GW2011_GWA1_38_7]OGE22921.1 MAG: 30S ribosomal protein S7 [Candidatus Daviesbacteria bacterium RIFCSPHIGHO2_01_FULL_38_8]